MRQEEGEVGGGERTGDGEGEEKEGRGRKSELRQG